MLRLPLTGRAAPVSYTYLDDNYSNKGRSTMRLNLLTTGIMIYTLSVSPFTLASSKLDDSSDIFSLSLEELANIKITTGSLFSATKQESTSAITIIEQQQIKLSGAKNLANLLEQHVPGMMLMNHSEGNKIGLRGHIAAENYKLLLLVNGKNVTNMVYEGVITEIDQWDMGDIERVEVIHGPGSVTYGTGAIAGVINIITKTSQNTPAGWSLGFASNTTYNSEGLNLQYSNTIDDWGIYAFISQRETDGIKSPDYYLMNPNEPTNNRYVGKGISANAGPQDFLADSLGRPQIKAHINISHSDNFDTWLRYTQSGQTRAISEKSYTLDSNGNDTTETVNGRNIETRSFIFSSDYRFDFAKNAALKSALTFDTQEYIRYRFDNREYNPGSINNIRQYAFSQDSLRASLFYDIQPSESLSVITGYEYSHIKVGAPWGENIDHLWIKEGVDLISSIDSSIYLQDSTLTRRPNINDTVEVGNGMRFETHSHLLESKYEPSKDLEIHYAHRFDYPDVSDNMFSPRISLISRINKKNTLVATLQRAQRMMPLRAQYLANRAGNRSTHETLDSLELSYTNYSLQNTSINVRAYYNETKAVGFTGERLEFLTDFSLFGLELSGTYKIKDLEFTVNHAYLSPQKIRMNDQLKTGTNRNNISFSDYHYNTRGDVSLFLTDYGNGLNNWSKNITKLSLTKYFMEDKLKAHLNAQVYWDYDGAYDEVGMYQQAYNNFDQSTLSNADQVLFAQQYQDFLQEKILLDNDDGYKTDYNLNISLSYNKPINNHSDIEIKIFAENIIKSSKRYYVSTGSTGTLPNRLKYLEKPRMYGLSVQVNFH